MMRDGIARNARIVWVNCEHRDRLTKIETRPPRPRDIR
jgi:hypothetical protein